jgi:mRNA interferase RelE/StbE
MEYKIVFTRRATRDVSRLEPEVRKRIGDALKRYSKDPLNHARKMVDPSLGSYRFRIGDYRVIFDLEGHKLIVLRIGHRKEIYRG